MFDKLRERLSSGRKFVFSGTGGWGAGGSLFPWGGLGPFLPGSQFDYRREAGNLWENSAVLAAILWIWRAMEQSEPVQERKKGKEWATVDDSPLVDLLNDPNPYYDSSVLWCGTILSWIVNGNAYWYKVRGAYKQVIGLMYVPHFQVEPRWDQNGVEYISHYAYTINGQTYPWPVEDVVHLRPGINPLNTRKGLTIDAIAREVCTDNEAATASAAFCRNMGIPGLIVSPKPGKDGVVVNLTDLQKRQMEKLAETKLTGDSRGTPWVHSVPVDVATLGFSFDKLGYDKLRTIPEERICAVLGIPPVVLHLGAGLENSSDKHNIDTSVRMAWHDCAIPIQAIISKQVKKQLAPDVLHLNPKTDRLGWNRSAVPALKEDESQRRDILRRDWLAGGLLRSEWRERLNLPIDAAKDSVYYTDLTMSKPVQETAAEGGTESV